MAEIDIYVIDNSSFDLTMFIDSQLTQGEVGIQNVEDMVRKIERMCEDGDRIRELRIVGHGNDHGQYVGTDWLSTSTLRQHRSALARLRPLFVHGNDQVDGENGHVVMGGCRQGRNGRLLLELSRIFNVPVSGFTALQRPGVPGDEGGRTTCFITCTREGRTTADDFDEKQLEFMAWVRRQFSEPAPANRPNAGNGSCTPPR